MSALVNLWTQVRRQLRQQNGGTGNSQGWGRGIVKVCTNRTGSDITLNTVVKLSGSFNDARVTPVTAGTDKVIGVVVGYWATDDPDTIIYADAPTAHSVAVLTHGTARVNLDGSGATRGQYAFPAATGVASSSATVAAGAFGVFQGSGGASGTALVTLTGTQGAGVGGGATYGTPAIVLGTVAAAGVATTAVRTDGTIVAFDATVPAAVGTAAVGVVAKAARRDHVHGAGGGTPVDQNYSDVAAGGSGPTAAFYDHRHGMPASGGVTFGTPAIVLGTAAAAGSIDEPIRRDSTVVAFDATAPVTQAFADAAAAGSAAVAARRDHKHGMPANPAPSFATPAIVLGSAAAGGAAATVIRSDGTIAAFDTTDPAATAPGNAAVVGTAAFAARRDHVHPRLADTFAIVLVLDNGGVALLASTKADVYVPFACTIQEWTILADVSGSIVLDLWMDTYANYPPTVADTITAAAKPTVTTAVKGQSSTLTGWTTAVPAGDSIRVNVDSITSITRAVLTLKCVRT